MGSLMHLLFVPRDYEVYVTGAQAIGVNLSHASALRWTGWHFLSLKMLSHLLIELAPHNLVRDLFASYDKVPK